MEKKQDVHIFQGMQRDLDPHKHKPEYFVDAHNIRITNMDESTDFAVTSEKSTRDMNLDLDGKYLGSCTLNNYLIVFTHQEPNSDRIYIIKKIGDRFDTKIILKDLGFNINNPIESFAMYENEDIQKVYWIDGINQPRLMIIDDEHLNKYNSLPNTCFDFVNTLQLKEEVYITKEFGTGYFPSGCIQYAFNYYNKYGQESNIVWTSPLLYTSFINRAGSPEENIGNKFKIHIKDADLNFDYIRLYSIMRTSLEATPTVRLVKDVKLTSKDFYIEDDYSGGETIDPTSLLYIGGEEISANSIIHKDGTLFLGNIKIKRNQVNKNDVSLNSITEDYRKVITEAEDNEKTYPNYLFNNGYFYKNEFSDESTNDDKALVSPKGFKTGETYRLGVQFQYKTGKWSDPIYITDHTVENSNNLVLSNIENLVTIKGNLSIKNNKDYVKVRPVIVQPNLANQRILAQGILCPTVQWLPNQRNNEEIGMPFMQSSWFSRPYHKESIGEKYGPYNEKGHYPKYKDGDKLNNFQPYNSELQNSLNVNINEISDGEFNVNIRREEENTFKVSTQFMTFHSPDIQFNDDFHNIDMSTIKCRIVKKAILNASAGDISITTSSPVISSKGSGFLHKTVKGEGGSLMSGFFYNDSMVDYSDEDDTKMYGPLDDSDSRYFMVYPWHRSGSLNNDCVRGSDGTRSAVLKRKVISNIKISNGTAPVNDKSIKDNISDKVGLFTSDQLSVTKIDGNSYYGNIDTMISTKNNYSVLVGVQQLTGDNPSLKKLGTIDNNTHVVGTYYHKEDYYFAATNETKEIDYSKIIADLSNKKQGLSSTKEPIRMKYKSTPHAIVKFKEAIKYEEDKDNYFYVGELYRDIDKPYGEATEEVLKTHIWIPAGDAVDINDNTIIEWKYGDTYLQRFDCLKTYSFTNEDENSIIDIVSFMAETRVNAEGRYDKNKGNLSNLVASPINFNLLNKVYSQPDNFFKYRILDDDYYKLNDYNNTITWTLEHKNAEEVDNWTNINMASTIDLDGNKGKITSLQTFNNNIYAFQDNGISNILFNSRVQLNTSDGVPIEISNNYKVEGKRYITENVGCSNKWNICKTPSGIYFIDSNSKALYNIGGENGLLDISGNKGMSTWFRNNDYNIFNTKSKLFYDFNKNDLYINTTLECLNYNEKIGQFISFFDYNDSSSLFNLDDNTYCLVENNDSIKLWKLFDNNKPCNIFNKKRDYSISFISNLDSSYSKYFTNMELRADWRNTSNLSDGKGNDINSFFDTIRVSNEYQDSGEVNLINLKDRPSNLKSKFRVWRINLPRDKKNKRDRINNPWAKITLNKDKNNLGNNSCILHDLSVQYYI